MSLSIGIVGLPNVGKSTLFNALLKRQIADVGEYPFTTVEPNTGVVEVKDERLNRLSKVSGIDKKVPAAVKFIDIAGLIKGANKGEGLGNQFLSQIRKTDAILHLVRGFDNKNAPHVSGRVDPVLDISTINLELVLSDFEVVSKALSKERGLEKEEIEVLKKLLKQLKAGEFAEEIRLEKQELLLVKDLNLLTLKPMLYALNLDESAVGEFRRDKDMPPVMLLSAKLEAEINELSKKERLEYLKQLGLKESLLDRLIKECYQLLDLITFFTVKGSKQVQAWPIKKGKTMIEAAEIIHTDFSENFIKAQVIDYDDYVKHGGVKKCRELGMTRVEGKDYVVKDGEVIEFMIGS